MFHLCLVWCEPQARWDDPQHLRGGGGAIGAWRDRRMGGGLDNSPAESSAGGWAGGACILPVVRAGCHSQTESDTGRAYPPPTHTLRQSVGQERQQQQNPCTRTADSKGQRGPTHPPASPTAGAWRGRAAGSPPRPRRRGVSPALPQPPAGRWRHHPCPRGRACPLGSTPPRCASSAGCCAASGRRGCPPPRRQTEAPAPPPACGTPAGGGRRVKVARLNDRRAGGQGRASCLAGSWACDSAPAAASRQGCSGPATTPRRLPAHPVVSPVGLRAQRSSRTAGC